MNYRKSIETTEELSSYYDTKYTEMGDGWVTPADECNRHLDDLGVPFNKGKRLLDVGCGAGHFLAEACKRVECVGVEISSVGVELSSKRAPEATVLLKTIEAKDGFEEYDFIVSMGSLEHVIDIDSALERIRELLTPDGKWYFYCPNENWHYTDQPNERTMSESEWVNLFQEHGLYTIKMTRWGAAQDNTAFIGIKQQPSMPAEKDYNFGEHLKLNIGSGQRPFQKPWINVDCQEKWKPDVLADANSMPMFKDASADTIVLHHVLEHFGCGECIGLLRECYRILEPGGKLLIFVPNIRALAQRWLMRQIDDYIFCVNLYGAYMGDPHDRHLWGYSFDSLKEVLVGIGLSNVKQIGSQMIPGTDVTFDWWILSVEAVK